MTSFAAIVFAGREWLWPAVAGVTVLFAAVIWSSRRSSASLGVRIGCGFLKLVGISLLTICLLEPLWVGQRARPGANGMAILADNSQSMQVKDTGESQSRGELLRQHLTGENKAWRAALETSFQVRRYTFDSRLQSTHDFGEFGFQGRASALGSALTTAVEHWRGQPMAGVLLFTDGNATDLAAGLPALEGCPPIYPVLMGDGSAIRDLALRKVDVSQTAFEDAPVTVQARVAASGFGGAEIVARLTEVAVGSAGEMTNGRALGDYHISTGSNVVNQLTQRASGSEAELNFRFQLQPGTPGLHFYELETRAQGAFADTNSSSEATLVNNRQMLVVDRGQEPLRVLYVSGRPNWEYKFLNRAIQDDAQVKMVSLIRVARREPKFDFKGRAGESNNPLFRGFDRKGEETARYDQPVLVRLNTKDELELRGGFPKVAEELFQYQAVILDAVEAEFFTHDQLALLQRFVSERGGGFLMLGGAESFREGNYAETTVASLLPVYLDRQAESSMPEQLKLTLTRDGWLQPWTRLRATEAEEKNRLEAMPAFEVFHPVQQIKPGASVLATVSDAADHTYPALVVQRFGLGRSAALMVGDLWRWGLQDEAMHQDLGKCWRQLVRWLVADVPGRVSVTAEKSGSGDLTEVRLTVKARDPSFKPLDNAAVQLTVRPVRLQSDVTPATNHVAWTNYVQLTAEPSLREAGTYSATYIAREPGAYSVEALVTQADGEVVGHAAAGWASDPAREEFRSLKLNRALLESLAQRTGGEVVAWRDLEKFVKRLPEHHAPVMEAWSAPLWHQPAVFLFALSCFVAEWGIRRWKGMP